MRELPMKIKKDYVNNDVKNSLLQDFKNINDYELIGGIAFYDKRGLIEYTQEHECDWVSSITGPFRYTKLSEWDYKDCLLILSLNRIPFYFSLYLITENKEWFLSNISPCE